MGTEIKIAHGQCATDTSNVDVTIGGESRTPTGAIFLIGIPSVIDTTTNEANMGMGFTDFSNSGATIVEASHNVATTDCNSRQDSGIVMGVMSKGLTAATRTFTATAITGGVRVTSGTSGTAYRFVVIMIFESACKYFAAGDGVTATNTFSVAHGFSNAPKAGIFSTMNNSGGQTQGDASLGFMAYNSSTIVQRARINRFQSSQINGESHGELRTDTCVGIQGNSASQLSDSSVTTVDGTNVTFTQNTATKNGNVLGLLIEANDITTYVGTFDAANSNAVDWDITGVGFTPQAAILALSTLAADDAGVADSAEAGVFGVCAFDDTTIGTVCVANEHAVANTDTASRVSQALLLLGDDNNIDYNMDNPSFNADGATFAAADITTAHASTHRCAGLFFEAVTAGGTVINRVLTSTTAITDPTAGTVLKQARPGDRVEDMNDAIFLYTALGRLIVDNFNVNDAFVIGQQLDRIIAESLELSDIINITRRFFHELSDTIAFADSIGATLALDRVASDSFAATDAQSLFATRQQVDIDSIVIDDSFEKIITVGESAQTFVKIIEEALVLFDTPQLVFSGVSNREVSDTLAVDEFIALQLFRRRLLSGDLDVSDGLRQSLLRPKLLTGRVRGKENYVPNSEDVTQWTQTNVTVTPNDTIAPNGTMTADKITDDATLASHVVTRSNIFPSELVALGVYRATAVYVKAGTGRYVTLGDRTPNTISGWNSVFDTQTGLFTSVPSAGKSPFNHVAEDDGNDWWRISFADDNVAATYDNLHVGLCGGPDRSDIEYSGTGDTIYVWGGHLNEGVLGDYLPNPNSVALIEGVFDSIHPVRRRNVPALADSLSVSEGTMTAIRDLRRRLFTNVWIDDSIPEEPIERIDYNSIVVSDDTIVTRSAIFNTFVATDSINVSDFYVDEFGSFLPTETTIEVNVESLGIIVRITILPIETGVTQ